LFDSEEPEFDQDTYIGRFEEFRSVADPFKAFFTNGRIREMQAMLDRVKAEEQQHFEKTGSRKMERSLSEIKTIRTA
jgi:Sideroflexins